MFIFITVVYLILLYERLICFFSPEKNGKIFYKWLTILPASIYFFIILCVIIEFNWTKKHLNPLLSILGIVFIIMGIILRRKAIRTLGHYWSAHIKIFPEHKLIKDGLYKIMRHPYLFSVVCELTGFCLFLNSFFSVLLVFLIQVPILIARGFFEEEVLCRHFGIEYSQYRNKSLFL